METYTIKLERTITAKNRQEAIKAFWEVVDEAENHDLSVIRNEEE